MTALKVFLRHRSMELSVQVVPIQQVRWPRVFSQKVQISPHQ